MSIYNEIIENLKSGMKFVLATIVKTAGSTPRKACAKMIVYENGAISGTVGGGDFERLVIEDCLKLIEFQDASLFKKYSFSQHGENATGMCCGGNVEVFMEMFNKQNNLYVFGGGHVGKKLLELAKDSDFSLTVVDDREDIIESFGKKINTQLANNEYESFLPELDENSFAVIVSRSHQTDCTILKSILTTNCRYVGLIGSKAKVAKMFSHLKESGVEQYKLDKVRTPIGLDINADGPYEIAVAILAELIAVKNEKR